MMMDAAELAPRVSAGDRRALARAITLVESARPDHRVQAQALVAALRATGRQALRIGTRAHANVNALLHRDATLD